MKSSKSPIRWKTIIVKDGDKVQYYELDEKERLLVKFKRQKKKSKYEKRILSYLMPDPEIHSPAQSQNKKLKFTIQNHVIYSNKSIESTDIIRMIKENQRIPLFDSIESFEIENLQDDQNLFGYFDDSKFDVSFSEEWKRLEEKEEKEF